MPKPPRSILLSDLKKYSIIFLGLLSLALSGGQSNAARVSVEVDGTRMVETHEELRVNYDESSLKFRVSPEAVRSRYMLRGLDSTWVPSVGEANIVVRFTNGKRDNIMQMLYPAAGESEGWNGTPETSRFTKRSEEIVVPEGAEHVSISMTSSGPKITVGILAVKNISVESSGRIVTSDGQLLPVWKPEEPFSNWNKSGIFPSMAKSYQPGNSDSAVVSPRIFVIEDNHTEGHADWEMSVQSQPSVTPGDKLTIRWEEAYSIGVGGVREATYDRLAPGNYHFILQEMDLGGNPVGEKVELGIVVTRPYWEQVWFWVGIMALVALLSGFVTQRRTRTLMERTERHARLIADERLRIARDLHDDLGARLSHIHLLGAHAQSTITDEDAKLAFQRIDLMAGELIATLSETVWMLNSANSDLESLVNFLCRMVGELCRLAELRCRIDALSVDETMPVSHEFRHNFSLAVKETIHNVLKHAKASEIRMRVFKEGMVLSVIISDDGIGLGPGAGKPGNGLESVQQRMNALKGNYRLTSRDQGVEVALSAPIA